MSIIAVSSGGSYIELPDPAYQGYKTMSNELAKADRNTLGNLIKERIAIKKTIEVEWHGLSKEGKDEIMSATSANTFSVRYVDMTDDTVKYSTFYLGSDAEITGYGKYSGASFQYYDVKISLIEV